MILDDVQVKEKTQTLHCPLEQAVATSTRTTEVVMIKNKFCEKTMLPGKRKDVQLLQENKLRREKRDLDIHTCE
jgi:hypothetical protein